MATTQQKSKKRAFRLPNDPERAIQEMMSTIDALRDVYQRENNALGNADIHTFMGLQKEKLEKAETYQNSAAEILSRKNDMKAINPSTRKKFERLYADFADLSQENMQALDRMQRCTERLNNTLHKAAKESLKKQKNFSYGQKGALQNQDRKSISMGVTETA